LPALKVTDSTDVAAAVRAFVARNKARGLSPLILIAPALASDFLWAAVAQLAGASWLPPDSGDPEPYVNACLWRFGETPAGEGWTIVVCGQVEDEDGNDVLRYSTLAGRVLVPYVAPVPILPEDRRQLVVQVLDCVKTAALAAKEDDTYAQVKDWLPSEPVV